MKKFLFLVMLFVTFLSARSQVFNYNGVGYEILSDDSCMVTYLSQGVIDIIIPDTVEFEDNTYKVTTIDHWALSSSTLETIILGNNIVDFIWGPPFLECENLLSVVFGDGITKMNNSFFYECPNVRYIRLGKSVSEIDPDAFYGCPKLRLIDIDSENPYFTAQNGVIYNKDLTMLVLAGKGVSSITIPDTVISIAEGAFGTFYIIPSSLNHIYLSENIREVPVSLFNYCMSLEEIEVAESNPFFTSVDGVLYDKDLKRLIRFPNSKTSLIIPNGVTEVEDYAAFNCNFENVEFPETVTLIGEYAFANDCFYPSIRNFNSEIILPQGLKVIGEGAFYRLFQLNSIIIPDAVTKIGEQAFYLCDLRNLTIGSSVEEIGAKAFYVNLESVFCNALIPPVCGEDAFYDSAIHKAVLYVPEESMGLYRWANPWNGFLAIESLEVFLAGVSDIASPQTDCFRVYDLNGKNILNTRDRMELRNLPKGIYIINGEKVVL